MLHHIVTSTAKHCCQYSVASCLLFAPVKVVAQDETLPGEMSDFAENEQTLHHKTFAQRWNISGYIELVAERDFDKLGSHHSNPLSDYPAWNIFLPNSCIWAEFDAGKGWTLGTQVSFTNQGNNTHARCGQCRQPTHELGSESGTAGNVGSEDIQRRRQS